jgi:hypothetical protein
MTATLLAHAGHLAPHSGTQGLIGVALMLVGAATALWWTRRRDNRSRRCGDDDHQLSRIRATRTNGPIHTVRTVLTNRPDERFHVWVWPSISACGWQCLLIFARDRSARAPKPP